MAKRRKLATLIVDFVADRSKLKSQMGDAEKDVRQSADKMSDSAKSVDASFGKVGERIEKSTAGVRKLTGAIGSVTGIVAQVAGSFTVVLGIVTALVALMSSFAKKTEEARKVAEAASKRRVEFFNREREAAEQYESTLKQFTGASVSSIAAARRELQDILQAELDVIEARKTAANKEDRIGFFEANRRRIEAEEQYNAQVAELNRLAANKRANDQLNAQAELQKQILDLERSFSDERVEVQRKADREIAEFRFQSAKTGLDEIDPEAEERFAELVQARADKQIKAIEDVKKAERAAEQAAHQSRLQQIEAEKQARMDAIAAVNQAAQQSIDNTLGDVNGMASHIKRIAQDLQGIRDQGGGL